MQEAVQGSVEALNEISVILVAQEANLFSIPLTVQVDESSTDFSQWTLSNFVYCNQVRTT